MSNILPASTHSTQNSQSPQNEDVASALAQLRNENQMLRDRVVALQRISSLGVLSGGIAHEINNALTPILNYAKLALRNPDPDYQKSALEKILASAERVAAIAQGVLGLARPRLDRREPADLARLTREVLLLTSKDLEKHSVMADLVVEAQPISRINPPQIQQVLLNLVINARQAMPHGGTLRVRVATDAAARWALISVADTGVGIAPPDLRRIFEPFFTTKTTPDDTGQGGTGLGLSVCREIVEAHRGRLRAESRPGVGTTFTLKLPIASATAKRQGAA